ncbi:hypothetical protein CERSUDRAFT_122810 [Gelatoporia subvermispora B]|uniref:NACHT domain-containing protein n=1 Tax=Ceriporiopsis subvermispora (strain B) TaxID=914234 RepID=M2RHM1_CERS8|nr:hypothetical protein CERSUDRAFT_122810 [Gelatoporia subvermispora B]
MKSRLPRLFHDRKHRGKKKSRRNNQEPPMGTNGEQAEQNSAHAPVHSVPSPSNLITPVDIPTGTPSRPTYQDVQVVGEVAGETCIASCTSPRDAPSLPPFAGEIGHVPVSEFATSLQAEDGSSRHTEQGDQNSAQPIALDACSSPSQLESMLQAALDKYKQRTKKDLTKEPFIAELENCKTTGDFIDCQEKGKAKGVLTRTLNQMVDVLLALHLNETLGEGIGIVWKPGKAVIGAIVVLLETIRYVSESYKMLMDLLEDVSSFIIRLEVYSKVTISPKMGKILTNTLVETRMRGNTITPSKYNKTGLCPCGKNPRLRYKILWRTCALALVEVMSILGLATEQIKEGRFKKYMKTLLRDPAVQDAFKTLDRLALIETRMATTEGLTVLHNVLNSLNVLMQGDQIPAAVIQANLGNLTSSVARIERDVAEIKYGDMVRDCYTWLSPPDPSTNHITATNSHHEGTAAWFTEGEVMQEWRIAGSLLWIYGMPGLGKTVLCRSAIIEALRYHCIPLPNSVVTYFYCDFRDSAKQDVNGLLSHLLLEISAESGDCTKILCRLYSNHNGKPRSPRPSNAHLQECLEEMLRVSTSRSIYIVIDALDECPDSGTMSPRNRVLKLIQDLLCLRLPNVHFCLTSRPETDIAAVFSPLNTQSIAIDENIGQDRDMADYVRSCVDRDAAYGAWNEQHKALVVKVLSEKANGMFRWVSCQLDMLRGCPPAHVEATLHSLPETLYGTYDRILNGVEENKADRLLRIFQCLTVCRRPLRIQELAEVLAVDVESDIPELKTEWRYNNPDVTVLAMCSTLVVVNPHNQQPASPFYTDYPRART